MRFRSGIMNLKSVLKSFEELKAKFSNPDGVSEVLKKVMTKAPNPINEVAHFNKEDKVDNSDGKCFPYRLLRLSRIIESLCSCEQLIELFASRIQKILSQVLNRPSKLAVILNDNKTC